MAGFDMAEARAGQAAGWQRHSLPNALGSCSALRWQISSDLAVVYSRYQPLRDLREPHANPDGGRTLVVTVGLEGASAYDARDGSQLCFRRGYTTVSAFCRSVGERRFAARETVTQLRLLVGEATLARYGAEGLLDGFGGPASAAFVAALSHALTPPAAAGHASALARLAQAQAAPPIDIHIHALSLLAEPLRAMAGRAAAPGRLRAVDVERLERVRALMQAHMDRPLTLAYLCAAVGINEQKLKAGFRAHFGTTVHRMLTEMRMREALSLLESGHQVAEAAYRTGYGHPSNFSAAFSRFYGRAPKTVFGKRR